jgi:hypothetical protein
MATALYGKGRNHFAFGDIIWKLAGGSTIKATLIDAADYVLGANIDVHEYMNTDTVPAAAKVGGPVTLTLIDAALGVCDAQDAVFSTVSGDQSEVIIIWKDGGGGGTSASGTTDLLIAYIDNATGLPVTPNGGDINVAWDNGANKIFKL